MAPSTSLMQSLRRSYAVFSRRRRWQTGIVLGLMLLGAFTELLTIGAAVPVLALLANANLAQNHPRLTAILDNLGLGATQFSLTSFTGLFIVVAIGTAVVRMILLWASQKFVYRLGYDLGVAVYGHILNQPYSFHVANNSSRILSAIDKVQWSIGGLFLPLMQLATATIISLFIFLGLLFIDAPIALAAGAGFGLTYAAVSAVSRRRLRRNSRIIADAATARVQTVQEGLGGIRDVIIDRVQPLFLRKFALADSRLRDAQAMNALIGGAPRFVVEGLGMVLIVVLALILSQKPGGLAAALPVLGALALGAQRMLPLLQQIYYSWTQVMTNQATLDDVLALLSEPVVEANRLSANTALPFERAISLEKVSFRYTPDGPLVLHDLDLIIPRGSRVGFIGKTGSGKSTLIDLLLGLLTPITGEIRIDDERIVPANTGAWHAKVAHVPQHIYLSDASIAENIAFGVPEVSIDQARVRKAARDADLEGFITSQPQGYGSFVGERGIRLSGGQRQRIGIARALYKQSAVLVLDEATSALDEGTESRVLAAIDGLDRNLTVLIIAHRTTTLRNCDIIYRLESGRLVESDRCADVGEEASTPDDRGTSFQEI